LEDCDIEAVTELEQKIDEAFLKKKLKEAIAKRFSKKETSPRTDAVDGMNDAVKIGHEPDQHPLTAGLNAEVVLKMEAKQRLFDITKNLDNALE